MPTTIRFHLDENVDHAVAHSLLSRSIDVTTTAEVGLLQSDDLTQLAYCLGQSRVLVTHDRDFIRHHAREVSHAGIAYCHQKKYSIGEHLRMLLLLHACSSTEEMKDRLEYL